MVKKIMWLAIDTSTRRTVLALKDGSETKERLFEPRATQKVIFGELANLLDPDILLELEGIVVGIGPGSFTGLKIGATAAKTLAWSRELPIIGVGSLEAVAAGMEPPVKPDSELVVAVPSTRGEAYVQICEFKEEQWKCVGPIIDIHLKFDELNSNLPETQLIVTGESTDALIEAFAGKRDVIAAEEKHRFPSAKGIFAVAEKRIVAGDFDNALTLVPMYIRPSQPERLDREAGK